ncbi:hypothetical protein FACS1894181_01830 [Bacteroidia bacterium]|nr:hypothetical protein FACS1894181_01830 [Bacteroidia bacterium]
MGKGKLITGIAESCRALLGAVFVFSGFVKAIDPMGFGIKIGEYLSAFGLHSFQLLAIAGAFVLIAFEFSLGVCLLLGAYRRLVSILILVFMGVMTPLTLYLAVFNPVSDCGCFGDALVITNWETFLKNIVLLAAAVFLFLHHRKLFRLYPGETRWFIPVFSYLYCLAFLYWNYNHLPVIDFRPYKTGVHIPSQMIIPEGAPEDEYNYSVIYEKDGVKKTFTLDNYPANDTAWTFVETKAKLVKKGYVPPVSSFNIWDLEGEDVTGSLLENPNDLFLLISPKLEEAGDERIDEITNLYEYAQAHGTSFYCVTGSSKQGIDAWIELTGAEYPFLTADEVLLKTMIRSNPGLIWLRKGQIMMKRHNNDLPGEESEISRILESKAPQVRGKSWIVFNLLSFSLPLLAVWVYGFLRFTWKNNRNRPKKAEKE